MGYPVYDCDSRAKTLMNTDPQLRSQLTKLLGEDTYRTADGQLNRSFVAAKIFGDPDLLLKINAIVHPAVAADIEKEASRSPLLFVETAIYYESGFSGLIPADRVWCISAPDELRITRAMQRDKASRQQVLARINSQISQEEKIRQSDATVWNDGSHSIIEQVNRLLQTN
jgi:dephospho-CoA kinase